MATTKTTMGKLSDKVRQLLEQRGYDPLEKQVKLAQFMEKLLTDDFFKEKPEILRCMELLTAIHRHVTPYCYPQLKAVEHTTVAPPERALTREERLAEIARLQAQVRQHGGIVPEDSVSSVAEA